MAAYTQMIPFAIYIYVLHNPARRNMTMNIYMITTFGSLKLATAYVTLQEEYSLIYERLCNLTFDSISF